MHAVEPSKSNFAAKARIRRAVEAEGIPHTYVCSNCFAGRFLPTLGQFAASGLPTDKVTILGDGSVKGKHFTPIFSFRLLQLFCFNSSMFGPTVESIAALLVGELNSSKFFGIQNFIYVFH